MLSKIIITSLLAVLAFAPTSAEAHRGHHHSRSVVKVEVGWVWVTSAAYWYHPSYGKSYRAKRLGPPPRRPHARAVWVPGHWVGKGHHRRWVQGHWRR